MKPLFYMKVPSRPAQLESAEVPCIPIRIGTWKGRVLVLCPVNRLNDIPKGLPFSVQADLGVADNFVSNFALLTKTGRIYSWAQDTL